MPLHDFNKTSTEAPVNLEQKYESWGLTKLNEEITLLSRVRDAKRQRFLGATTLSRVIALKPIDRVFQEAAEEFIRSSLLYAKLHGKESVVWVNGLLESVTNDDDMVQVTMRITEDQVPFDFKMDRLQFLALDVHCGMRVGIVEHELQYFFVVLTPNEAVAVQGKFSVEIPMNQTSHLSPVMAKGLGGDTHITKLLLVAVNYNDGSSTEFADWMAMDIPLGEGVEFSDGPNNYVFTTIAKTSGIFVECEKKNILSLTFNVETQDEGTE